MLRKSKGGSARTVMPRDNPWSHTDAPPASEEGKLEDWHFDILGVNSDASDAQVRKAYKEVILQFHPDKTGNADVAKQLNERRRNSLTKRSEQSIRARGGNPSQNTSGLFRLPTPTCSSRATSSSFTGSKTPSITTTCIAA